MTAAGADLVGSRFPQRDFIFYHPLDICIVRTGAGRTSGGDTRAPALGKLALFRRSRQVRATAAGDQRSFLIVEVGFSGRKLTAHAHDACLRCDVTGHGGFVIIHAQVDRRYRTAKSCCNGVICSHVDDGGKDAAMRETAFGMDDPFLAPGGLDLDAVFPCADCRKVEPLIEGSPHDQFLKFFDSYRFIAHRMSPGKSLSPPTRVGVPYQFCWCRRAATVGGKRRGADAGRPDRWPERTA